MEGLLAAIRQKRKRELLASQLELIENLEQLVQLMFLLLDRLTVEEPGARDRGPCGREQRAVGHDVYREPSYRPSHKPPPE